MRLFYLHLKVCELLKYAKKNSESLFCNEFNDLAKNKMFLI